MRFLKIVVPVVVLATVVLLARSMRGSEASEFCTNADVGFRVAVPPAMQADPSCELFDTDLAALPRNTDAVAPDVFVIVIDESVDRALETFRQGSGERVIAASPLRFGEAVAWRVEAELIQDQLRPAGARSYRYFVPVARSSTAVFSTVEDDANNYAMNRGLLDEVVARVEPIPTASSLVASLQNSLGD
jgi:hypothetical protein